MYNFRRSSLQTWDEEKERGRYKRTFRSLGGAKKFTDTPGRRTMRRMVRVLGKFFFFLNVAILLGWGLMWLMPSLERPLAPLYGGLAFSLFICHFGFFLEMGADSGGKNWFAMSVGLFWIGLISLVFVGGLINIIF